MDVLKGSVPNLAPDQTRYAAPLLSIPESSERFHLQTPNTDTSYDVVQREHYALFPRHVFFSLDAGALIRLLGLAGRRRGERRHDVRGHG